MNDFSNSNQLRKKLKDYPDVMNIDELCSFLNVGKRTGYNLVRKGKIKCLKIGRIYRIPKVHIIAYLNCNE